MEVLLLLLLFSLNHLTLGFLFPTVNHQKNIAITNNRHDKLKRKCTLYTAHSSSSIRSMISNSHVYNNFDMTHHENNENNIQRRSSLSLYAATADQNTQCSKATLRSRGISLPTLTKRELLDLASGQRVQKQNRSGRAGHGLVVVDVKASAEEVFNTLTQFDKYVERIPTVRSSCIYSQTASKCVAEFRVSRFSLRFNVIHSVYHDEKLIKFQLDDSRRNMVMRKAEGFWYVQTPSDRPDGYTRIWLSAEVIASMFVPNMIVDYAAGRALPRATKWLQPYFANEDYEF